MVYDSCVHYIGKLWYVNNFIWMKKKSITLKTTCLGILLKYYTPARMMKYNLIV